MKNSSPAAWFLGPIVICLLATSSGCTTPSLFVNEHAPAVAGGDLRGALPSGMRRTKDGWEDASTWFLSEDFQQQSLDVWMKREREREPGWVRRTVAEIRETPPWMVAAIQISAIAAIVHLGRRNPSEQTA